MSEIKKIRRRGGSYVPDEVYLALENAIDEIMDIIDKEKENKIRPNTFHMIGREFQFMLRDKMHEVVTKKTDKNKEK